ncbi:CMGC/CDK/CRK7 protein kinase [Phytophthora cinnamomi]|uniref:CMGC/CDK/CRK7 protein kinase n=1 Tax=Phytophthora cinnamomi TaxID=4785 RepID=UPI0035594901|nr:CMGC/CDK/CRK7 protein kinase [Phytophthora cinnamomi]
MADAPSPPSPPPAPSSPPPPPPAQASPPPQASATPASAKKPARATPKARRTARTPPVLSLATPDAAPKSRGGSSFSSPLPPCPEDPPAPPPPSCTPPKYRPLEENENTEDEQDDARSGESADEPAEPQSFPTPPPPPSPPVASPLGTPPPPPPPPYSPPSAKIAVDLSGALESAVKAAEQEAQAPPPPPETPKQRDESGGEEGDDERDEAAASAELLGLADASPSSVIASMRSAVREREIMAADSVREPPAKKPRFYVGDIDNYSIIDKVGSGTYGEVFKCQHKVTKDIVALKKLRPDVEKNGFPVTSIREMKILKYLKHPNIVELKEIVSSSAPPKEGKRPPLYFAFEYMEHDLSGLLNHPRVKFTRTQIQCYMRQLLTGIAFMHRNKIIHRDIKASNLLLNNQGMLKVGDFGLSRFWNEVNAKAGRYTNKVVTLWYRPPELLMGSTSFPPHAVDLLEKLLQLDPAKRITAAEAMDHDYFWRVQTCKPRE